MKKPTTSKIQWYEPSNNRQRPTATMKKSGVLCFGVQMRKNLSGNIRIGFDFEENTIVVEQNPEQGFKLPKDGEVKLYDIALTLQHREITLPATFLFFYEKETAYWKGHIVPPMNAKQLDGEIFLENRTSIFIAYKWLTSTLVSNYAKTTPIDERHAIANAALWEAVCNYTQMCGPFKEYLLKEIKTALIKQNRHYVEHCQYNHLPLDASVHKNDTTSPIVYDLLLHRYRNEMLAVDNKIYMDIFRQTYLDSSERKILAMLLDGYTEIEISEKFNMAKLELYDCCESIGNRWGLFRQDSM